MFRVGFTTILFLVIYNNKASTEETTDLFYEFRTKCDITEMHVTVFFNRNFEGILYAKGYAHDPQCRTWANVSNSKREETLDLPFIGCGSRIAIRENSSLILNTVIVQHHRFLHTEFDMDYEVECGLTSKIANDFHSLYNITNFEENDNTTKIFTTLEINSGQLILGRKLAKRLRLENKLLLAFLVSDSGKHNDLRIKECIAHDDQAISRMSSLTPLTQSRRCPLPQSKYLSRFEVVTSKTEIMAFAQLKSMAFSTRERQLHITCEAELCLKRCSCNRRNKVAKDFIFTAERRVSKRSVEELPLSSTTSEQKSDDRFEVPSSVDSLKRTKAKNKLLMNTVRVLASKLMQWRNRTMARNATRINKRVSRIDLGEPQVDLGEPREDLGEPREDLGEPREDLGEPREELGEPREDLGEPREDLGEPREDLGEPREAGSVTEIILPGPDTKLNVLVFNDTSNDAFLLDTTENNGLDMRSTTLLEGTRELGLEGLEGNATHLLTHVEGDGSVLTEEDIFEQQNKTLLENGTNELQSSDTEDTTYLVTTNEVDLNRDDNFQDVELYTNLTSIDLNIKENCVPNLRFLTVSVSLGFIIVCLLFVIIGMFLYIRKERKKHALNSFLLYSFQ